jgi:hypothetical protein
LGTGSFLAMPPRVELLTSVVSDRSGILTACPLER